MFMPLNGLLRLFRNGLPLGVLFGGPLATRDESSMRDGWRFCSVAAPRVDCHDGVMALAKARASQNGQMDDVRRNMLVCDQLYYCHMRISDFLGCSTTTLSLWDSRIAET